MAMIFDTLKLSKSLRRADFSEAQADAFAAALSEQVQDTLATKADLLHLEVKIGEKLAELKEDNVVLRSDMTTEFAKIRNEMALMRAGTIKWIVTATTTCNFVATAALFATFFKLFAKQWADLRTRRRPSAARPPRRGRWSARRRCRRARLADPGA